MKILYSGGLQIRSKDAQERLLNVDTFLDGELAFHNLYREVKASDFPIAQDCFGDQFFIRDNLVVKLNAETGEIDEFGCTWEQFLAWVDENPIERLSIPNDLDLQAGQLLFAYPPFCTAEGNNASIKAIDGVELIRFHADFAKQVNGEL
ncbi:MULTISPECIES: hypothetical protein [Vibrio]|nr:MULTISPECIES: hypothetical protein [Vibrio]EGR0148808.1 hypothetical protein [Vibrio alginolyticus]EGR2895038.1 hypothetical protein [Vibrio parahaemolyticus]EGR2933801.1 hypothetical protein [Vibrio parahaemolyticus]EGR2958076.1 hypothetical protein [Vibrio parahaemolyticus]EGR2962915.1 hypothetical protein [Vibrio parahaemolyticus]